VGPRGVVELKKVLYELSLASQHLNETFCVLAVVHEAVEGGEVRQKANLGELAQEQSYKIQRVHLAIRT
jgi:hypothetical protein